MHQIKVWIVMKQSTNLELNEPGFWVGLNVKDSHTLTTTSEGTKNSRKDTNRLTIRTVFCFPRRSLPYRFLVLDEVKCKTHTQQQRTRSNSPETVNLTDPTLRLLI